ncbi:MAG: hypothetical protein LBP87_03275 [Planctomycetaceae bacterium]|nr:hypothetical protein [Planctomycetaceae bacterium]
MLIRIGNNTAIKKMGTLRASGNLNARRPLSGNACPLSYYSLFLPKIGWC